MVTPKTINKTLSIATKQQLQFRDQQVSSDPFGIKAKGSNKKKADVVTFLNNKYKDKYRKQFVDIARESKCRFESGILPAFATSDNPLHFLELFDTYAEQVNVPKDEIQQFRGTFEAGIFDLFGKTTMDKVNTAADVSANLMANINGAFEKFSKDVPQWVGLVSFCVFLNESMYIYYSYKSQYHLWKFNYTIWLISGVLCVHFLGDAISFYRQGWDNLLHLIESMVRRKPVSSSDERFFEAGMETSDPITAIISLVVPITLSVLGLKKTTLLGSFYDKVLNVSKEVLSSFSRMRSGVADISSLVCQLISYLHRVVRWAMFDRNSYRFPEWNQVDAPFEIEEYCHETAEFCLRADKNELTANTSNYFSILNLIARGECLLRTIKDRNCVMLLQRKLKELTEIKSRITTAGCFIQGARPEPHAIVLEGPPGQGKSSLVDRIHTAVWAKTAPEDLLPSFREDPLKYQYVRCADVKYWEGYTPEKLTCIYDDFGQSREELTGVSESLELIRAINSYPFHLNYAEINSKSNNFFVSRLMLITTNALGHNFSPILNHQDALHRRLNKNRYKIMLKDRYKISRDTVGRVIELNEEYSSVNIPDGKDRVFDPLHPDKKNKGLLTDEDVDIWKLYYSRDGRHIWYEPCTFEYLVETAVQDIKQAERLFKLRMEDLAMIAKNEDPTKEFSGQEIFDALAHGLTIEEVREVSEGVEDLDGMDLLQLYEEQEEDVVKTVSYIQGAYDKLAQKFNLAFKLSDLPCRIRRCMRDTIITVDLSKLSDTNKDILAVVGTGCALAGSLGIAYGIFKLVSAWRDKSTEANFESYTPRQQQTKPERKFAKRVLQPQLHLQAGSVDEKAEQFARKMIKKNLYQLSILGKKIGYCLFVKGTLAIFPAHFEDRMDAIAVDAQHEGLDSNLIEIEVTHPSISSKSFSVFLPDFMNNVVSLAKMDIAMVDFKRNTVQHYNLMDKLHLRSDENYIKGMLCIPETEGLVNTVYFRTVKLHYDHAAELTFDNVPLQGKAMISYADVKTQNGDCGSPLIALGGPNSLRPFIGFHVGSTARGEAARGYAARVFFEDVNFLTEQFEPPSVNEVCDPQLDEDPNPTVLGSFESGFIAHKKYTGASKSKFVKTILYEWGKQDGSALKAPTRLTSFVNEEGERIVPMEKAMLKYDVKSVAIHDEVVAHAERSLHSMLGWTAVTQCPYNKAIFSFDEAVIGIHGDDKFDAISRTTSPGYPHVLNNHTHGKKFWFGDGDAYDLHNPQVDALRVVVNETIEQALKGKRRVWVFLDNMKDELVPKEKVLIGKTRLFSATPLELLILFRMYFGAFTSWVTRNHTENGVAVGLNPYSYDWHRLATKLSVFDGDVIAGDFSGYDTRQVPKVLYSVLNIINSWYNDGSDNALVRSILWEEIVNSRHMYGDRIYSWTGSLPSGNPITSIVNCLYNHMLFRMCWRLGQCKGVVPSDANFNDEVYLCVLGDDNIMTSSVKSFNQNFLSEAMEVFGQNYTDEYKREILVDWRKLSEVSFLKRTFRYDDTLRRYVAPLCVKTLREILWWQKNSKPFLEQASANLELVLREYSLHDPKVWEEAESTIHYCHILTHGELLPRYRSRLEYLYEVAEWEQIW